MVKRSSTELNHAYDRPSVSEDSISISGACSNGELTMPVKATKATTSSVDCSGPICNCDDAMLCNVPQEERNTDDEKMYERILSLLKIVAEELQIHISLFLRVPTQT